MKINIINNSGHPLPQYETELISGMDIRACIEKRVIIKPLQRVMVATGLYVELPEGYEALIRPRSGLAYKHGISIVSIVNAPGIIDMNYQDEIKVLLLNLSDTDFVVNNGDRIAQMSIVKHESICWKAIGKLKKAIGN